MKSTLILAVVVQAAAPLWAASYYTVRLDDPKAVYLTPDSFGVRADGAADDSDGIQKAIDRVQETTGQGVVFLPDARYRLTRTINVWPGIRLIGSGAKRPVLVLAANTPGYQDNGAENYLIFFAGSRGGGRGGRGGTPPPGASGRGAPPNGRPSDAGAGTFYSAMSNVDLEIGDGNAGAVGVRGLYAQHSFLG